MLHPLPVVNGQGGGDFPGAYLDPGGRGGPPETSGVLVESGEDLSEQLRHYGGVRATILAPLDPAPLP